MPTVIDATYRVVTPLFCSGAEADQPELRLASFKGVLRFWWRALAWSQYGGRLETIREHENLLFGSPDSGQSRVIMRLMHAENSPATSLCGEVLRASGSTQAVGQGARYLGYGLMEAFFSRKKRRQAGQLIRACLRSPFEFAVQMRGRDLSESEVTSLRNALIALGTLGGMGAKSRKGYGSMVLQSLHIDAAERWSKPKSPLEMRKVIASLRNNSGIKALPEFTALSPGSRHVLVSSEVREPVALLNLIGCELLRFRSWGRNGKILGRFDSERRFEDDHDLMKQKGRRTKHPRRIAFGLPHNYGPSPKQQVKPNDRHLDRRASPLFIHIHECGDSPIAVLSFLPSRFLPAGKSKISVGGTPVRQAPEDRLYRPIHEFLDRLRARTERKERFSNAWEVQA